MGEGTLGVLDDGRLGELLAELCCLMDGDLK
jgi:hypothetical protein